MRPLHRPHAGVLGPLLGHTEFPPTQESPSEWLREAAVGTIKLEVQGCRCRDSLPQPRGTPYDHIDSLFRTLLSRTLTTTASMGMTG